MKIQPIPIYHVYHVYWSKEVVFKFLEELYLFSNAQNPQGYCRDLILVQDMITILGLHNLSIY
ncbi:hypothetical protein BpHYR1_049294 [Brachionus plicatilis]|uniref:Uncharacterized protein n=1 Tax=Brachionus plicatilis TaxID=10195 RepID=A0A3M7P5H9_BRAPC|nr:hypothetical protein BpHYR1_049294 [Brachionus plicatilis]